MQNRVAPTITAHHYNPKHLALAGEYNRAWNSGPRVRLTLHEYYDLVRGFADMAIVLEPDSFDSILSRLD